MYTLQSNSLLLCLLVLLVVTVSRTPQVVAIRPNFLVDQSATKFESERSLLGIFGQWEKDDTVPDYSSETTHYGLAGNVKVDKTHVYTDKERDPNTGATKEVETKLTGSASGKKDAGVELTYQSKDGVYQGLVEIDGKEASGNIHQKYRLEQGDNIMTTENVLSGSAEDSNEKAGVKLGSTVLDCSSGSTIANCAGVALTVTGEKVSSELQQNQEYNNKANGGISTNKNQATGSTSSPQEGQKETFEANAFGVNSNNLIAQGNLNAVGSEGIAMTASSDSSAATGK